MTRTTATSQVSRFVTRSFSQKRPPVHTLAAGAGRVAECAGGAGVRPRRALSAEHAVGSGT